MKNNFTECPFCHEWVEENYSHEFGGDECRFETHCKCGSYALVNEFENGKQTKNKEVIPVYCIWPKPVYKSVVDG